MIQCLGVAQLMYLVSLLDVPVEMTGNKVIIHATTASVTYEYDGALFCISSREPNL